MSTPDASLSSSASGPYRSRLRRARSAYGPSRPSAVSGASIPAEAFDDSHPGRPFSITVTLRPLLTSPRAAAQPITPAPTITTSGRLIVGTPAASGTPERPRRDL